MQRWHIVEGEAGCRMAVDQGMVAMVVDALRASAMAAMLLQAGATELLVVREVEEAFAAKQAWPDALLYGERGGLPPEGFDGGNSPSEANAAKGKRVIFTTTTGAGRLISAWGSAAVYMGTTVNADAVVQAAARHDKEVVLIPAGLATDPNFDAQEDWVAAVALAMRSGAEIGEGAERFAHWRARIDSEGVPALFASAPHAEKLRRINKEFDIGYCAQCDLCAAVPKAVERHPLGVLVHKL
jgi:2-phosphosulfolactate phosphatase